METVSAQDASKLSIRRRKCESPLFRASHQSFAAGKSRIESTLERSGRFGALDHDQVIVLRLRPDGERFAATVRSNRPSISRLRASAFGAHGDRIGFLESVFFAKPALL